MRPDKHHFDYSFKQYISNIHSDFIQLKAKGIGICDTFGSNHRHKGIVSGALHKKSVFDRIKFTLPISEFWYVGIVLLRGLHVIFEVHIYEKYALITYIVRPIENRASKKKHLISSKTVACIAVIIFLVLQNCQKIPPPFIYVILVSR